MKKYILTAAMVMALSSPALAQGYNDGYDDPMTGLYAGVQGGYSWLEADSNIPAVGSEYVMDGTEYGVFVGYKLDKWLQPNMGMTGALEAHYEWSNNDDTVGGINVEKDSSWGVQFRPGIAISDTINPYGIIGYKRANFEASAGGAAAEDDYNGFELGIGTELVAYGDLGFRVDYSHTWYEDNGAAFDPNEHSIKAGVAYHF